MSGSICSRSFADLEWWNTFAADFVWPGDYFSGHLRIFCSNTKVFVGILLQISANKFFSWILVNHEGDIRLMITIRFFRASGWSRQIHSFIHTCSSLFAPFKAPPRSPWKTLLLWPTISINSRVFLPGQLQRDLFVWQMEIFDVIFYILLAVLKACTPSQLFWLLTWNSRNGI